MFIDQDKIEETRKIVGDRLKLVLQSYLKVAPQYMEEMERGLESEDVEMVLSGAHSLKSSSSQVGALKVSSLARDIELLCERGNVSFGDVRQSIMDKFNQTQEIYRKTSEEIDMKY